MATRMVTISLDAESHALWMKLPEKSVWVRRKLYEEIFDDYLDRHLMSERARTEGIWDNRCNPNNRDRGICPTCWPPDALGALSVNPGTKMYIPPSQVTPKWYQDRKEERAEMLKATHTTAETESPE